MAISPDEIHLPTAVEYLRDRAADVENHDHGMVAVHAHSITALLDAYDERVRQDGPDAEPAPSDVRALRLPTPTGRRRWEAIDIVLRRYGVDTAHVATTSVEFDGAALTLTLVERSGRGQTRRTIYLTESDVQEIERASRG